MYRFTITDDGRDFQTELDKEKNRQETKKTTDSSCVQVERLGLKKKREERLQKKKKRGNNERKEKKPGLIIKKQKGTSATKSFFCEGVIPVYVHPSCTYTLKRMKERWYLTVEKTRERATLPSFLRSCFPCRRGFSFAMGSLPASGFLNLVLFPAEKKNKRRPCLPLRLVSSRRKEEKTKK